MKLRVLPECPDWPVVSSYGLYWNDPILETFAETAEGPATHVHIYELAKARERYRTGQYVLPASVVTVSYQAPD